MYTRVGRRRIVSFASSTVAALHAAGQLPPLPEAINALRSEASLAPPQEELDRVTWTAVAEVVDGELPELGVLRVSGILGYLREYDHHRNCDRLRVVHIAGSRRAVVELLRHIRETAEVLGLGRPYGEFDSTNIAMISLCQRLGWRVQTERTAMS